MEKRLRTLTLGVLGGVGTATLLLCIAALVGGLAAAAGAVAFNKLLPPTRAAVILVAGAVAGAVAGGIAPRVRSPGGAALLGAAAAMAANGVIRAVDPGADGWRAAGLGENIALLLLSGVPGGLGAPVLWAPVRAAAARPIWRAAADIAGRVGAFVLALFTALLCAALVLAAAIGLIAGVRMLPRVDVLLRGLGYAGAALALGVASVLCLRLAKVPRGRGALPGFEHPPPVDGVA